MMSFVVGGCTGACHGSRFDPWPAEPYQLPLPSHMNTKIVTVPYNKNLYTDNNNVLSFYSYTTTAFTKQKKRY